APAEQHIRQELEDHREEPADHRKRNDEVPRLPDRRGELETAAHVETQGGEQDADDQRDEQEKTDGQHDREREEPILQESEKRAAWLDDDAPDPVQRVLQLGEDRGGAKEQQRR